tara:strand:+ start:7696 stop:8643 length:948 start_codon:yes stop_codon:yes gene_type:complete
MALDLTGLTNYVKENEQQLATALVFAPKTAQLIEAAGNVQVGIKSSEKINLMDTDAVFQAGGTCGFSSSGTTAFTQRSLAPGKIKINESICPKSFEAKYTQKALRAGSSYDYMPFADEYSAKKIAVIGAALETGLWQGDTGSGDAQLNKFNGLLELIAPSGVLVSGVIDGNPDALTVLDSSNVIPVIDAIYTLIPASIVANGDVAIFVGMDTFRTYTVALKESNLFHYAAEAVDFEIIIPGTNVKLIAVNGLNETSKIVATRISNLYLGVDLLNEEERFELFYAKEADEMRFVAEFKMGVQYAFPSEIVYFALAD